MNEKVDIPEFSVMGGPLNNLGLRLRLIRKRSNSVWLGVALSVSTWVILFVICLVQGSLARFFSFNVLAAHIRLLIAIPLFFLCESWVAPKMASFVDYMFQSGLVTNTDRPKMETIIRRIQRAKNFWVVELLLFGLMIGLSNINVLPDNSSSAEFLVRNAGGHTTAATAFYIWFCLPLYRFLFARWLWHLALWWYFLVRVQTLNLRIIPTHSDGVGGLGYLEIVQEYFAPLILSYSVLVAASSFEEIKNGAITLESLYYLIPALLAVNIVLFAGPLLLFYPRLRKSRENGLKEYMTLASRYTNAFDRKWIRKEPMPGDELLGSGDIQSLADLTNSVKVIQQMKTLFVSKRLLTVIAACTILPFVPFVFMKFNVQDLMALLFKLIVGN